MRLRVLTTFALLSVALPGGIGVAQAQTCPVVGVADGTFEAGRPWTAWTTQTSTGFGTPLCDAGCGNGGATAPPFAGANWAWFGGGTAVESSTLGQSLVLPVSTDLRLRFQMRIGAVAAPANDTFVVAIDGTPVQTFTEPVTAEAAYTQREINLTSFANGASHSLLFTYNHPSTGSGNLTVDNVEVVNCENAVPLPSLSINDVSVTEGDSATKTATFTVSLSAASASTVTANYSTADGSATADGTPLAGPWAGRTAQNRAFSFTVLPGGTQIEPLTFSMTCVTTTLAVPFNIVNGQFSRSGGGGCTNYMVSGQFSSAVAASGTVSIVWLSVPGCPCTGSESTTWSTTPTLTVSDVGALTEDSGKVRSRDQDLVGNLTAGADYLAALGTLSFPPGTTSKTISVTIIGDTTVESNETFSVNLSTPTNATIARGPGVGTIVNDDGPVGPSPSAFYTLSPCRIVDTRDAVGALGGPALQGSAERTFALAGPTCAIPTTATALSINVTVTGPTAPGDLRIFPGGVDAPLVSTINFSPGQTRANDAIIQIGGGTTGSITVRNDAAGTLHLILDVNGYFQ